MKLLAIAGLVSFVMSASSAVAGMATGEQIKAAVSGNTVQGSMDAAGPYTEYYSADGTVFGKDYKAKWSVEGDTMCWVYDGQPKDCWNVEVAGDQVKWIKDGKPQGSGTVLQGNPNNFQ